MALTDGMLSLVFLVAKVVVRESTYYSTVAPNGAKVKLKAR